MVDKNLVSDFAADFNEDNTAFKAVTDTINQMAGSLTGRNLDQKIQEYTSVYGEILLGMHNRLNDIEKETKSLRKEVIQQHKKIDRLEHQLTDIRSGKSQTARRLSILSIVFALASFAMTLWLLLTHTTN